MTGFASRVMDKAAIASGPCLQTVTARRSAGTDMRKWSVTR